MTAYGLSRRSALTILAAVAATAGLNAACGSRITPVTATPTALKRDSNLIYGVVQPIASIAAYPFSAPGVSFRRTLWDTLISLDPQRRPVPELAESWTVAADGRTLTLKLRDGVVFHSGRAFAADDAVWNIEYLQDPKTQANAGEAFKGIRATALNKTTLRLDVPEPVPQLFSLLAGAPLLDSQSDLARSPGGTGPFKLDAFEPGNELRLIRHPRSEEH